MRENIEEKFNLKRLQRAIDEARQDLVNRPSKPKHMPISGKAWKVLFRILEDCPDFLPDCESAIWLRAEQMGL